MMRHTISLATTLPRTAFAAAALLVSLLAACETEPPYASCDLDIEVKEPAGSSSSGKSGKLCDSTETSCVVRVHPHCAQKICLSYFGHDPVCSEPCTKDSECGVDAFCWTFAEEDKTHVEKYCVPNRLDTAK